MLGKKLRIDMVLSENTITKELADKIVGFEPFGMGNPDPLFLVKDIEVVKVASVGSDGVHLKMTVRLEDRLVEAIAFNFPEVKPGELVGKNVDLVYSLEENTWNNRTNLQLKIRDLRII
jgi:single-stranded-DNA-specific exonuclease